MPDIKLEQILTDKKNLERILDNLTEGILAHDMNRRIFFLNKAAEKITGYQREEVLGMDCHEAFGGPFCGGKCAFLEGRPPYLDHRYYPLTIQTTNRNPRRIEMRVLGMRDNGGRLSGVIASFRDISDLIALQEQLGDNKGFSGIIGQNPKMLQVYRQIRDLSGNDYPVCITGETGTGKELVAAAIHRQSRQGRGRFVPVNCAALPEGILESELFGHVKGAFTGAVRDKKGRFELAKNGTLFLDEVADLPKSVQAKLLRALQERRFEPLGSEKTVSADVRLISATNRDLKREMKKGNFRDDLYYRINVVPIHLPPLKERKEDIPFLAEHFLNEARKEGRETGGLSEEALAIMMAYHWPGNVRELQSAIHFSLVKSRGHIIQPEDLPLELKQWKSERSTPGPSRKLDRESVRIALAKSGGNKAKAARTLGVGRATLYRFLADFPDVS
jgi:PAS domain S-box-containing protein